MENGRTIPRAVCAISTLAVARMRIACAHEPDRALHRAVLGRRRKELHQGQRHRVPVRAVRGHARQAEREARARASLRRADGGRRRLRGLRGRRHRPVPARPGPRRHARPAQPHAAVVEAGRGAARLRRLRGGRGVALLPADDPAPPARPRARHGLRVHDRRRARVLPRARARRRRDRAGRPARPPRPALLRHARPDAQPRLHVAGVALRDRLRLEQLRQRPRGRERPVRAELRLLRRAHDGGPVGLLPLHGRVTRAGARHHRHVHAEAVRPPHRQRLPLPHEPVEGRRERLRGRRPVQGPARPRPVGARLQLHRRPEEARQGVHRADRAHGLARTSASRPARAAARAGRPCS